MESFGYGRGSISKAGEEAIRRWTSERETVEKYGVVDDPVEAIRGMLRHVEKTSLELQHQAKEIRARKRE